MYENISSCVRVNDVYSDWFPINWDVKQGCVLSPTLFDMFINDLMQDIQALNIGIDLGKFKVGALLYADDVVVLGETEGDLQTTLDIVAACIANATAIVHGVNPETIKFMQPLMRKHLMNCLEQETLTPFPTY